MVVESCIESAVDSAVIRFLGLGSFHSDSLTPSIFRYSLCDHIFKSLLFSCGHCHRVDSVPVTSTAHFVCCEYFH